MTDEELISALRSENELALSKYVPRLEGLESKFRKHLEETALPPGAGGSGVVYGGASLAEQLGRNGAFATWVKERSRAHYTASLKFPLQRKVITSIAAPARLPGIVSEPQPALRVSGLFTQTPTTAGSVSYVTGTYTPAAAVVAETVKKPEASTAFAEKIANMATVAVFIKASLQSLADTPSLGAWLETNLMRDVLLKLESVLLAGDAPSNQAGLISIATAVPGSYVPSGGTTLDAAGGAIAALLASGFTPDGLIMAGPDLFQAKLLKLTDNGYLWSDPATGLFGTEPRMWGLPVVVSPFMTAGTFLAGAFRQSGQLFIREDVHTDIAYENEDDFLKNLACVRAEMRAALTVALPQGILKGVVPGGSMQAAAPPAKSK